MSDVFKGAKGFTLVLDCIANIGAATVMKIRYRKPDGTVGEWVATMHSPTEIEFTTSLVSSELDQEGNWVFQAYVATPTWELFGDKVTEHVEPPYVVPAP